MSAQDMVLEIHALRGSLDSDARRLFELAQALRQVVRRKPADDLTSPYINYANAWTRFANMVGLGLRRTATVDRVLAMLESQAKELLEEEPLEQPEEPEEPRPVPIDADFDALFGEVLNA